MKDSKHHQRTAADRKPTKNTTIDLISSIVLILPSSIVNPANRKPHWLVQSYLLRRRRGCVAKDRTQLGNPTEKTLQEGSNTTLV